MPQIGSEEEEAPYSTRLAGELSKFLPESVPILGSLSKFKGLFQTSKESRDSAAGVVLLSCVCVCVCVERDGE